MRTLAIALAALVLAPQASAATHLGIFGNLGRFQTLTGQQSRVGHVIVGWNQTTFDQLWPRLGPVPMLGFGTSTGEVEAITPLAIARGSGDPFLLALSRSARNLGRAVYIRPLGEMNGHWNPYSAFDRSGRSRGAAHSSAAFRKAFARIYLIMHGGPEVNARLGALRLPPVRSEIPANPLVTVVWNPQGFGSPDIAANAAQAYYPGDAYVDVVGDDLYDIGGKAEWAAADRLYRAHPGKPFAFPEWGLWGLDDPAFVRRMATFVRTHPRTTLLAYFNAKPGSLFDLASKPRSLAAYRRYIVPLGQSSSPINAAARAAPSVSTGR
jgi:hypothetical protein